MRPSALVPALFCAAAVVLSFLCLFAGHKRGFMEDYHLLTLNTSRIGQNLLNTTSSSDNPISNLFHNITNSISDDINDAVGDLAEQIGVEDFYSAHLLDYCFGTYIPIPLANSTVSRGEIHKNVTGCSNRTAMNYFNPNAALEESLRNSGMDITLEDLNWPDDIQRGIDALRVLQKTVFVLYCISIGLSIVALFTSLMAVFFSGRLAAMINLMVTTLAWLALALASAIVTAVIVKGANIINEYGDDIGVEAHSGRKFLAITWAATASVIISTVVWCLECVIGHRRRRTYVLKHG